MPLFNPCLEECRDKIASAVGIIVIVNSVCYQYKKTSFDRAIYILQNNGIFHFLVMDNFLKHYIQKNNFLVGNSEFHTCLSISLKEKKAR